MEEEAMDLIAEGVNYSQCVSADSVVRTIDQKSPNIGQVLRGARDYCCGIVTSAYHIT